jgi:hypothetical protein
MGNRRFQDPGLSSGLQHLPNMEKGNGSKYRLAADSSGSI